jgi:hypothetical protein
MTTTLDRRTLLKSVGLGTGSLVLTPILQQLAAYAAGDARAAVRPRVVFFMQSNGMNPAHLVPVGVERRTRGKFGTETETLVDLSLTDHTLPPPIEPLSPFKDRLALVQGLSGRIALSDHSCNHGALGCYPANKGPMGQTIDLALAEALPSVFGHVGLGLTEGLRTAYSYSAASPGQATPIVGSPELAFKSLFGSVAEGAGRQEFDLRTNLLDFMADDVARSRAALVGEERAKLDRYLAAFESLHARQAQIVAMRDAIERNAPQLGDKLTTSVSSEILAAHVDIAAAALIAGLTRVVTITTGEGGQRFGKYPELGIPELHHIGHGGSYGERNSEACFVELRRFHTQLIAQLAKKLDSVPEGDGTMLDHTLIVYLSDSGESHHPNLYQWPVVLLGNLGGKLKTSGRYLDFPRYELPGHATIANLYCTLLHAAGAPRDAFGVADPGLKDFDQRGPIATLLA